MKQLAYCGAYIATSQLLKASHLLRSTFLTFQGKNLFEMKNYRSAIPVVLLCCTSYLSALLFVTNADSDDKEIALIAELMNCVMSSMANLLFLKSMQQHKVFDKLFDGKIMHFTIIYGTTRPIVPVILSLLPINHLWTPQESAKFQLLDSILSYNALQFACARLIECVAFVLLPNEDNKQLILAVAEVSGDAIAVVATLGFNIILRFQSKENNEK